MKIVMFYHSLVSDWNHGNAHFLRGVASELISRGHDLVIYEPADGWSRGRLIDDHGTGPIDRFHDAYPELASELYDLKTIDLEDAVGAADVVIVHEWSDPELVARVGKIRARFPFVLLFHDTHHRLATEPEGIRAFDLSGYDGVLAFGNVLRDLYLEQRLAPRVWTWHEAADTRIFHPLEPREKEGDLVWIGNWGDDERTAELEEFLIAPVRELGLRARVHGVRYPDTALAALDEAGIEYCGWLPNFDAPEVFANFKVTVHVPRGPYVRALPGIPTIRPFEAMACGIPLISAPWNDAENLFTPGKDYLVASDGEEMKHHLKTLLGDDEARRRLADHALATIRDRHTCAHRVDELMHVYHQLQEELDIPQRSAGLAGLKKFRHNPAPFAMPAEAGAPSHNIAPSMKEKLDIAFFGSSLVSCYWNGAATYYRGILRALAERGHRISFYEPDAFQRQQNRDMDDPPWAKVIVYQPEPEEDVRALVESCRDCDIIVKASGVGANDALLEEAVLQLQANHRRIIFWDVDAPATLERVHNNLDDPFRDCIPRYDHILTYGGGDPVISAYAALGARDCVPIYNALDPSTHFPVEADTRFAADLAFLGNRLPDREARVEEFFLKPAAALPDRKFLLAGSGWETKDLPENVRYIGHLGSGDHNAFNCTPLAVLNVSRESMATYGFSPATRIFEAAGAGACILSDAWEGVGEFLEPENEILIARNGDEVIQQVKSLTAERARVIGEAAMARVLAGHTYAKRVEKLELILTSVPTRALAES